MVFVMELYWIIVKLYWVWAKIQCTEIICANWKTILTKCEQLRENLSIITLVNKLVNKHLCVFHYPVTLKFKNCAIQKYSDSTTANTVVLIDKTWAILDNSSKLELILLRDKSRSEDIETLKTEKYQPQNESSQSRRCNC